MGAKEFDASFAEVADILTNCRPEKLFMLDCDTKVYNVHELSSYSDVYNEKPEMRGGGGTSFIPVFEKVEELGLQPDILIYFTDGYGVFPSEKPNYPVLWVSTTDQAYPFGEVVKVDLSGEA
jgi:predicted metal-dependent peptidase